jgi:NAD+ synthase
MPCDSAALDGEMARLVAEVLNLRTVTVDLTTTHETMLEALAVAAPPGPSDLARANIKPRLRMTTLYAFAQTLGYLVAGTGNRSEIQVGYFTKHGDGGVDLEPLGELYKWQVRRLARHLGIPQPVIDRPPTAGLWAGQTDEQEMGITYDDLDRTLAAMEAPGTAGVEPALLDRVQRMVSASAHKRAMPPVCPLNMDL